MPNILSDWEAADMAQTGRDGLGHSYSKTAAIYSQGAVSGAFDVVEHAALAVSLRPPGSAPPAPDRARQVEDWTVAWGVVYVLPVAPVQFAIDGLRWNAVQGTTAPQEIGLHTVERSVRVVRALEFGS